MRGTPTLADGEQWQEGPRPSNLLCHPQLVAHARGIAPPTERCLGPCTEGTVVLVLGGVVNSRRSPPRKCRLSRSARLLLIARQAFVLFTTHGCKLPNPD